jgi:hypothetical protein
MYTKFLTLTAHCINRIKAYFKNILTLFTELLNSTKCIWRFAKRHSLLTVIVGIFGIIGTIFGLYTSYQQSDFRKQRLTESMEQAIQHEKWADLSKKLQSIKSDEHLVGVYQSFFKRYIEQQLNNKNWSALNDEFNNLKKEEYLFDFYKKFLKEYLDKLRDKHRWVDLNNILKSIKADVRVSDLFNYFYGCLVVKQGIMGEDPGRYFNRIDPTSEYYIKGQRGLHRFYYLKYSNHPEQLKIKRQEMADAVKKTGRGFPYYYFLKLAAIGSSYEAVTDLYKEFRGEYSSLMNFENYKLSLTIRSFGSQEVIADNFPFLVQLPVIAYLSQAYLAISAHNQSLSEKKERALDEVAKIFEEHGQPGIRNVMKAYLQTKFNDTYPHLIKLRPQLKHVEADKESIIHFQVTQTD